MSEYIFRGGVEDGTLLPGEQILFFGRDPFSIAVLSWRAYLRSYCFPCVNKWWCALILMSPSIGPSLSFYMVKLILAATHRRLYVTSFLY